MVALELFMAEDEPAEMEHYHRRVRHHRRSVAQTAGLRAVVEHDPFNRVIPHAVLYFTPDWAGPSGHAVQVALAQGDPHIDVEQGRIRRRPRRDSVDPINLQPGDETIVAGRLREELTRR